MKTFIKIMIIAIVLMWTINSKAQNRTSDFVNFLFDQFELDKTAGLKIDSIVEATLDKKRNYSIVLAGHTDDFGAESYNVFLSQKRVQSVNDQLIIAGVPSEKIEFSSFGEKRPLTSNNHEAGRQINRRVEIIVKCECTEIYSVNNNNNNNNREKDALDSNFEHKPDTTIYCEKGAQITIDKEAFYPYPIGDITFKISEYYDLCDMIADNITTESTTGDCLTSGGMLFVRATIGTDEVQVNSANKIKYRIPAVNNQIDSEMKLYIENTDKNGKLEWEEIDATLNSGKDGERYYEFELDIIAGVNIDKPIKMKCYENPPIVKVRGYRNAEIYLTYLDENYLSKGRFFNGRKYTIAETVEDKVAFITVTVEDHNLNYIASGQLNELKYRKRKNMYIVKKKNFNFYNSPDGTNEISNLCSQLQATGF